jgi:TRAP-type C4-dicarboxylate transport system substrate-binding protein
VGAIALQWHTKVQYLVDTPMLYLYATLVVKKKVFDRIAPEDRKIMHEVMAKTFTQISMQNRNDNNGARQALQNQGMSFITPTEKDLVQWRQMVRGAVDKMGQEGLYSPKLLEELRAHLKTLRAKP